MAIINSYPNITELKTGSLLLVSDTSVEGNPTKTAPISDIISLIPPLVPGGGTMSSWSLTADNATTSVVVQGDTVDIEGGTKVTTAATLTDKVTITHDSTTRTDTTSSSSPSAGGTFTCVDSITQDATGHPTTVNVKTVTLPPAQSYTVYSALITQTGTNAPTAVVLENTIPGTMTWSYSNIGEYQLRNSGTPFTANKVQVFVNRGQEVTSSEPIRWVYQNTSDIFIKTQNISGVNTNGLITNGSIEIRIYS